MRQSRLPMETMITVATVLAALAWATLDAAAPPVSKPQWQRMLQGDDARQAADMDKQLARLQAASKFEEALKVAQALAELRRKVQGEDHWQAVNAR